jgi:hypothetical protein
MSQVLHIFRKDVRHHWPEMLISLTVLLGYAANQPRRWTGQIVDGRLLGGFLNALPILIIFAWALLIVRLVQGESLVGDRQFWITRPYEWYKLLAAKLISIFLFIHLPLFIAQVALLRVAHFPVVASIPGLLHVHLLFVMAIILPSLTIGAITAGIGQAVLALLAVFLLILGIVLLSQVIPDMDFSTDATDSLQGTIYLGACLTVIFVQYIYRKTSTMRLMIAGSLVAIALIVVLSPYGKIINGEFPPPTRTHPLPAQFALDTALSFGHVEGQPVNSYGDEVDLEFPLKISGLTEKTIVQIRGIKLDIVMPDGEHWTSHWRSLYQSVSLGRTRDWPTLKMKRVLFDRIKNMQIRARATLGFNVFEIGSGSQIKLTNNFLRLPGGATCMNEISQSWLQCFAALKQPEPLFVVANLPSADCQVSREATTEPWAPTPATFADLSGESGASLDFTPIQQFNISVSRYYEFEDRDIRLPVCSGTPLLVTTPKFLYAVRDEIDFGEITLSNYEPTYPREIVPPIPHPVTKGSPDMVSRNLPPRRFFQQPK